MLLLQLDLAQRSLAHDAAYVAVTWRRVKNDTTMMQRGLGLHRKADLFPFLHPAAAGNGSVRYCADALRDAAGLASIMLSNSSLSMTCDHMG